MSSVMYITTHRRVRAHTHTDESWEQSSDNVNCHTRTDIKRAHTYTQAEQRRRGW